jgi:hypothetical protein
MKRLRFVFSVGDILSDRVVFITHICTTLTLVTLDVKMSIFIQHLLAMLWTSTAFPIHHLANEFIDCALRQEKKNVVDELMVFSQCRIMQPVFTVRPMTMPIYRKRKAGFGIFSFVCCRIVYFLSALPIFHKQEGCVRIGFLNCRSVGPNI